METMKNVEIVEECDKKVMGKAGKMNISPLVKLLSSASLGAVIVGIFVTTANLSGNAGTIAALFTFLLVAGAALAVLDVF